jgi:hypothetical protein
LTPRRAVTKCNQDKGRPLLGGSLPHLLRFGADHLPRRGGPIKRGAKRSSMATPSEVNQERLVKAAQSDAPKIYANGFALGMSYSDITVVLEANSQTAGVLNLSFTCAKTLAQKLAGIISQLEEKSGRQIMTTDDIEKMFAVSSGTKS